MEYVCKRGNKRGFDYHLSAPNYLFNIQISINQETNKHNQPGTDGPRSFHPYQNKRSWSDGTILDQRWPHGTSLTLPYQKLVYLMVSCYIIHTRTKEAGLVAPYQTRCWPHGTVLTLPDQQLVLWCQVISSIPDDGPIS